MHVLEPPQQLAEWRLGDCIHHLLVGRCRLGLATRLFTHARSLCLKCLLLGGHFRLGWRHLSKLFLEVRPIAILPHFALRPWHPRIWKLRWHQCTAFSIASNAPLYQATHTAMPNTTTMHAATTQT